MNSYQQWIKWTYWLREAPAIYVPTLMDIIAVVILLFFIKRFREMLWSLLAMFFLVLLHAFLLPYSFTCDSTGRLLINFPFLVLWTPGFFICFLSCQAAASKLENAEDRELLHVGAFFLALYLLLHIVLMFC